MRLSACSGSAGVSDPASNGSRRVLLETCDRVHTGLWPWSKGSQLCCCCLLGQAHGISFALLTDTCSRHAHVPEKRQ